MTTYKPSKMVVKHHPVDIVVAALFILITSVSSVIAQSNLLINGSFEEGPHPGGFSTLQPGSTDIKGWIVTRASIDYIGSTMPSSHGKRHLDLDGTPGYGGVQQTFSTTSGQKYRVTFDMAGNPGGPPTTKKMAVQAAGQSAVFSHDADLNWASKVWEFTATSPSTTIEFYSLDTEGGYCGPLLDNVSVIPIADAPKPATLAAEFIDQNDPSQRILVWGAAGLPWILLAVLEVAAAAVATAVALRLIRTRSQKTSLPPQPPPSLSVIAKPGPVDHEIQQPEKIRAKPSVHIRSGCTSQAIVSPAQGIAKNRSASNA